MLRKSSKKPIKSRKTAADNRSKTPRRARVGLEIQQLEQRLVLASDVFYTAVDATALTLRLSGDRVELINSVTSDLLFTKGQNSLTSPVVIDAADNDVHLTIDKSLLGIQHKIEFKGGLGTNTLTGPDAKASWSLMELGVGQLKIPDGGAFVVSFVGVEHLRGGSDQDVFTLSKVGYVVGTIDGGDGADTLVGADFASAWEISDADEGKVSWTLEGQLGQAVQVFAQIENVVGGTDTDTFRILEGGSISGKLDGGGGNDILVGPDIDNSWQLTGQNTGKLGGLEFQGIENLTGGAAADIFTIGKNAYLTGWIDGGPADADSPTVNTLGYAAAPDSPIEVNLATRAATGLGGGFSGIQQLIGREANNNTLTGPLATLDQTAWRITGANSGTVDGVQFSKFTNLSGQDATSDAFVFAPGGTISGTIAGGLGSAPNGFAVEDTTGLLTVFQPANVKENGNVKLNEVTVNYKGMDPFNPLQGSEAHRVVTGTLFDRDLQLQVADGTPDHWQASFKQVTFSSGGDRFLFAKPSKSLTLDVGTGTDKITLAGNVETHTVALVQFSQGLLDVTGTAASNTLNVEQDALDAVGATLALSIDGSPVRSFQRVTALLVDMQAGDDEVRLDSTLNVNVSLDGGAGTDTLFGPNETVDWYIDEPNKGSVGDSNFTSFESLRGGTAMDSFIIRSPGSLNGDIDGGGGGNNMIASDTVNTWQINALNAGTLNGIAFQGIQNLVGGNHDDHFWIGPAGQITGLIDGGVSGDAARTGHENATDTIDFTNFLGKVLVDLAESTSTRVSQFAGIDVFVGNTHSGNEVLGPAASSLLWNITGTDTTEVIGYTLTNFSHLKGRPGSNNAFLIHAEGTISGKVIGGAEGENGLRYISTNGSTIDVDPDPNQPNGQADVDGKTVVYENLKSEETFNTSEDELSLTVSGTVFDDVIVLSVNPNDAGGLRIQVGNKQQDLSADLVGKLGELRVDGLDGSDRITVKSFPPNFGGSLILYGNRLQRNDKLYSDIAEDDPFPDLVEFDGNVDVDYLEVFADHIHVKANVEISTGEEGILFRQRNVGVATLENLSPALGTKREVSLVIEENAKLSGGNIFLVLQAEDKALSDVIGAGQEVSNFVIDPLIGLLENALALPVKVLVKETKATITIHENVEITSENSVGIYATAATDASGSASSSMFSIAYGQAKAYANIDIKPGVKITGTAGSVVITSTANATANVSATTERSLQSTPNPGGRGGFTVGENQYDKGSNQFAVAIGVAYADVYSHLTVAEGVEIIAGKTANLGAGGEIESEGSGEAGIFGNGAAGLGFGIQISKANIETVVNGTVTAKMIPGSAVKLEIDPTVGLTTYESDQTNVPLEQGQTVRLKTDSGGYKTGQILRYKGAFQPNANLATQAYGDQNLWEQGEPNIGYVDYEGNRIYFGDISLVTEDTVTYTNRYGTSIGGLVDSREYYLVADDANPRASAHFA
jgi:hypothetical protein